MKKSQKLLKIFLTVASSLFLFSCSKLPDFPDWTPASIIVSQGKAFKCKLVDKENFVFECDKTSVPLDESFDGSFCTPADQIKPIINWAKDAKELYEKNCKGP